MLIEAKQCRTRFIVWTRLCLLYHNILKFQHGILFHVKVVDLLSSTPHIWLHFYVNKLQIHLPYHLPTTLQKYHHQRARIYLDHMLY